MIKVFRFTFNPVQTNTYVVSEPGGECAIVDAGCLDAGEFEELTSYVAANGLRPRWLLFTHLHFDHVWGAARVARLYPDAVTVANAADEPILQVNAQLCDAWGLPAPEYFAIGQRVKDGDKLQIGSSECEVISTPGHTKGGLCYHFAADGVCLTGDTLFRLSVGRTDLPGGSFEEISDSIRTKLFALPDATRILPGHGPETTIGEEKAYNGMVQ